MLLMHQNQLHMRLFKICVGERHEPLSIRRVYKIGFHIRVLNTIRKYLASLSTIKRGAVKQKGSKLATHYTLRTERFEIHSMSSSLAKCSLAHINRKGNSSQNDHRQRAIRNPNRNRTGLRTGRG